MMTRLPFVIERYRRLFSKVELQLQEFVTAEQMAALKEGGPRAFDRMVACCEEDGIRPRIVQETPQWPTAVRLIAAGLGVSIAAACPVPGLSWG